jgi:predicted small metal-binding protein
MWRHQARCEYCGQETAWQRDREPAVKEITEHLREAHNLAATGEEDFHLARERQCDYCLEPCLDQCTKCARDFCDRHAGDIDGLCGGCI